MSISRDFGMDQFREDTGGVGVPNKTPIGYGNPPKEGQFKNVNGGAKPGQRGGVKPGH